jgi:LPS-assembly lipoprotein
MSLSDRRSLLMGLGAILALSGCGFAPAYAPGNGGAVLRNAVQADAPSTTTGFDFVAAFEGRLGRPTAARYALGYEISTHEVGAVEVEDLGDTRFQLYGTVVFSVSNLATGAALFAGQLNSFTTYSATSTQLATRAAQQDAERRLMKILADQVATRLIVTAADWAQ